MTQVIVDEALRAKLNGLNDPVELLDSSGEKVGHYLPADQFRKLLEACGRIVFTDEEVRQAEQQPREGRPLADIWKSLNGT
jgi:hypothetical protein